MSGSRSGRGASRPVRARSAATVLDELLARRPGYTPSWTATDGDPGRAVLAAGAAMNSSLWERLDRAGDKNRLSFLTELGIGRLPPAAARAPVVFEPLGAGGALVPEGSLVGATGADGAQRTFRTEHSIGIAAGRLAEVRSVVPGRDTVGDHSFDAVGGRPIELFAQQEATERYLYVGHDQLFAVRGTARITIELRLARDARVPLVLEWSIWDGDRWRIYPAAQVEDLTLDPHADGTESTSLSRSGTVSLVSDCIESKPTTVGGIESFWVRARLASSLVTANPLAIPEVDQIRLAVELGDPTAPVAYPVETALAAGQPVDVTTPWYPFGRSPDRTSLFHFDAAPVLTTGLDRAELLGRIEIPGPPPTDPPDLSFEYWNGRTWAELIPDTDLGIGGNAGDGDVTNFALEVPLPPAWAERDVVGTTGRWVRVRLPDGASFAGTREIELPDATAPVEIVVPSPPLLSGLTFAVYGKSTATAADHVLVGTRTLTDDHTVAARWSGSPFTPFLPSPDRTPTLYLGFDGALPAAAAGLYFEIQPPDAEVRSHELRWERHDGTRWVSLAVEDETDHLTRTGLVRILWPGNRPVRSITPVVATGAAATTASTATASRFAPGERVFVHEGETGELATVASITGPTITFTRALANPYANGTIVEPEPPVFGVPRTWIRARLTEGSTQPVIRIDRILANATWASETRRFAGEVLGSGTGRPNQRLFSTHTPILPGETVEVRELSGARARTDLPLLERELAGSAHSLATTTDATGAIDGVWVRWAGRPNLSSSGPDDRHYTADATTGAVTFGDGRRGRTVPVGGDNVRLSAETGGGRAGNVPAEAISTPLSGLVVAKLANPVAATGGADAEPTERAARRAPRVVRHRYQAVTVDDYAAVILEASPEVFAATVVAEPDDLGGGLRVLVLPDSDTDPPIPSAQLLERVRRHLRFRSPAGAVSRLVVDAPEFVAVGVEVVVAPVPGAAGETFDRVRSTLRRFLHPVAGGPSGTGWPFGASVHVGRFGPVLEAIDGVDHVERFAVLVDGAVVGDRVTLAPGQLPVAGTLAIELTTEELR